MIRCRPTKPAHRLGLALLPVLAAISVVPPASPAETPAAPARTMILVETSLLEIGSSAVAAIEQAASLSFDPFQQTPILDPSQRAALLAAVQTTNGARLVASATAVMGAGEGTEIEWTEEVPEASSDGQIQMRRTSTELSASADIGDDGTIHIEALPRLCAVIGWERRPGSPLAVPRTLTCSTQLRVTLADGHGLLLPLVPARDMGPEPGGMPYGGMMMGAPMMPGMVPGGPGAEMPGGYGYGGGMAAPSPGAYPGGPGGGGFPGMMPVMGEPTGRPLYVLLLTARTLPVP